MSLFDGLTKAMAMVAQAPAFGPDQHIVHPREYAWIENPVGPPPSVNAVVVALSTGAIEGNHPAAVAFKAMLFRETAQKEPDSGG